MISLRNVGMNYQIGEENIHVLKDINLDIRLGECISIMGPSGSGKSTLMNIIGCLTRPSTGEYLFEDKSVTTLTDNNLAKIRNEKIGFIFQQFHLLPKLSTIKNVELPMIYYGLSKKERIQKATTLLKMLEMEKRMWHLPTELSGGQKQRVAIARSLVNSPSIILADEPTGALDSKNSIVIMNLLQHFNKKGTTIVVVTHDPEIAKFTDKKITIEDGRITNVI